MRRKGIFIFLSLLLFGISCKDTAHDPVADQAEDLSNHFKTNGVMLQAFYWDVEPRGEWWNILENKIDSWAEMGIDRIWLPPVSKGMSGPYSMGYDPMDYFDFGEYEQMGTTKTRFGSREELEKLINKAHSKNMEVIADIVLNHNSGGGLEFNPYRGKETYTLFSPKSGMFPRTSADFHPNTIHERDAGSDFFPEQDLCHDQQNVKNWLWESDSSVAKYYKNVLKFDGWRFDYVKGFDPSVIKSFRDSAPGFSVLEAWDGNVEVLKSWVNKTGSRAFDFALFYNLEQALDGNDLQILRDRDALNKTDPENAVTFVANHDTEKDTNNSNRINSRENKLLAYAYILTHPGYPCIFYSDLEDPYFKEKLISLIAINRSIANGTTGVLFADKEVYVAQRNGLPGLIVAINNGSETVNQSVSTKFKEETLYDYAAPNGKTYQTDKNGRVNLNLAPKSYLILAPKKF